MGLGRGAQKGGENGCRGDAVKPAGGDGEMREVKRHWAHLPCHEGEEGK